MKNNLLKVWRGLVHLEFQAWYCGNFVVLVTARAFHPTKDATGPRFTNSKSQKHVYKALLVFTNDDRNYDRCEWDASRFACTCTWADRV